MTGQQLKNSILQMAVQGKLVHQDPNDEPASVLLERIRAEKEQLIKEGKIKKEKNPSIIFRGADNLPYEKVGKKEPVCIADAVPFEIPDTWEWTRINSISLLVGNKKNQILTKEILPNGQIPVVSQGKCLIDGYCNEITKKINTLPLVMFGDHTRNVKYIDFEFVIGADGTKFHKILSCNPEYVYYWMLYAAETLRNRGYARHYTLLKDCFVPLPPMQEQTRIVTKLKSILPLIEKYDYEEKKLTLLSAKFPDLLKKSILQEAVQGKLVPQDSADEPASVLLDRIRAEKEQLIKAGKLKRDKHESLIFRRDNSHYEKLDGIERCIDDEIPFDIPDSWEWTRFGQVIALLSGTDFKPEEYNDSQKGTPYITGASSLSDDGVLLNRWTETPRIIANRGDVLLVCKGSGYGKTVICDIEEAHIARQIMAIKKFVTLDMHYIRLFLQANFDKIKSKGQGVIPGINRSSVMNLLFPIPPLAEQCRIVEKQRELFDKISLI